MAGLVSSNAETMVMASVNLTCTSCDARRQCERCRSIAHDVRAAGHSVTQTSRYDALRAATIGAYGFDACIVTIARDEPSVIDAAMALLTRTKVGLVVDPSSVGGRPLPGAFCVIDASIVGKAPFPTHWIEAAVALEADKEPTRRAEIPMATSEDAQQAQRRLKSIARRAQRELGAAGFSGEPRLDLLAALEDEIAWASASDTAFGIILVHVAHRENSRPAEVERLIKLFESRCREAVRSADAIAQGTDTIMVVLSEASPEGTSTVANRVKKAVRAAQKDVARDATLAQLFDRVTLGTAAYPSHGTTRAALLGRATASTTPV